MELWFDAVLIACAAMLIDRYVGDVPNRYHPLRWMGNILDAIDGRVKNRSSRSAAAIGFLSYLSVLLLFGTVALLITSSLRYGLSGVMETRAGEWTVDLGEVLWILSTALLAKVSFSLFLFRRNCRAITEDLRKGDLDAAADKTQMMVNRRTRGMDEPHITSSCCETVSENLVDSVLSPFFYYGLFGMFGAAVFRCANLMDAMWGRRTERYNMIGRFPAVLDDVLGFIPSRLSPLFVGFSAWALRFKGRGSATGAAMREHRKTPSPNSGWPMTAAAAALGVSFEKKDVYVMGEGPLPSVDDVTRCCRLVEAASEVFLLAVALPLSVLSGIHVQVCMEDWLQGLMGVF